MKGKGGRGGGEGRCEGVGCTGVSILGVKPFCSRKLVVFQSFYLRKYFFSSFLKRIESVIRYKNG